MFKCKCGREIEQLVVAAHKPGSQNNQTYRPVLAKDGLRFVCNDCANNLVGKWHNIPNSKDLLLVEKMKIWVVATNEEDFVKRLLPQMINKLKKLPQKGWFIGENEIKSALEYNVNN